MENESAWIGPRLREIRKSLGLTQEQLALRIDMPKGTLVNIEQGRTIPSWETVVKLAKALGVSCAEFMKKPTDPGTLPRGRPKKPKES